jgi:tRNA dimethylallyltransferase
MIEKGLIDEVKSLQKNGYHYKTHSSLNTVGIKEVFDHLEGLITYDRMLELIKQNSRRYAKRQLTWFRKDKSIEWIEADEAASYKIPFSY